MTDLAEYRYHFTAMGGPCSIRLFAASRQQADNLFQLCEQEVRRFEQKYSRFDERSTLSHLNRSGGNTISVDVETARLLNYANTAYRASEGLFDITSGIFRKVWDFKNAVVPDQDSLDSMFPFVGWQQVHWNGRELQLPRGMELDLGGLVKEYAADAVRALLEKRHCEHAVIELGGDIVVAGPKPDGSPWTIGIRHPDSGQPAATLAICKGAIASSGDYERYFIANNRRYCHILNPFTGLSSEAVAGVSVVAPHCVVAGTLSTIAMLKGACGSLDYLSETNLPHLLFHRINATSAILTRSSIPDSCRSEPIAAVRH